MSTAAADQAVDPVALIRSRDYRRLLVVAAVIGVYLIARGIYDLVN